MTVVWLGLFAGLLTIGPEFIPGALIGFLEPIPYGGITCSAWMQSREELDSAST